MKINSEDDYMECWKKALYKFIDEYKTYDYIEGIFLSGSYAKENNTDNSDIDVCIILNDELNWRERGTRNIDGFLIEYFINPSWKIREEFEEEVNKEHSHCSINMYAFGKILYDKNGNIKILQEEAIKYYEMPFSEIDNIKNKFNYYGCRYSYDEFVDHYNSGFKIYIMFVTTLKNLINSYLYKNGFSEMSISKMDKLFLDDEFRKKYRYKNMPNDEFCHLVKKCLLSDDRTNMYRDLTALYEYVMKDSGFNIEEFSFRSEISKDHCKELHSPLKK